MENIKSREKLFEELIVAMEKENISYDLTTLKQIFNYANEIYGDAKRYKGESTFSHAVHVACIVATLKIGTNAVYAAVLHECPKFEGFNSKQFEELFGEDVSSLVIDSSKLYLLNYDGQKDVEAEKLRKMFMAIAKDIRVVIIKLADRLYNMRNIESESEDFKKLKAHETLNVYAPIAHRLGMSEIKSELEDISFSILNPEEFNRIKDILEMEKEQRKAYIELRIKEIKEYLDSENITATIYGRPKYIYSIYKKTKKNNCDVLDLFDLYAIRVVVDEVKDCYNVLGIIHQHYKPLPGKFKDYISVPKTNMYQSLHTTLFGGDRPPFEVQIRTWHMHEVAEYGVAAHFLYKEGSSKMTKTDEQLTWIRKTLELEEELNHTDYSDIKIELFGDEVFVYTPKGEIKALPKGATVIDFAYEIHQHVGNSMVGAKINRKIAPITTQLKNGDVVEIITSKTSSGPKADWLNHIITSSAKSKITSFIKKQGREINIEKGKEELEKEIVKQGLVKEEILKPEYINPVLEKVKLKTLEDYYESIGFGVTTAKKALNRILEEYDIKNKNEENIAEEIVYERPSENVSKVSGVVVKGIDNCLIKLAKCCSPIPGDEIIGYISIGKGVSVHKASCPNISDLDLQNRRIDVMWANSSSDMYDVKIKIIAYNKTGISMEVLKLLQDSKLRVKSFFAKENEEDECIIDALIGIDSLDSLQKVIHKINSVENVKKVIRNS